jgi:hypothetical protein
VPDQPAPTPLVSDEKVTHLSADRGSGTPAQPTALKRSAEAALDRDEHSTRRHRDIATPNIVATPSAAEPQSTALTEPAASLPTVRPQSPVSSTAAFEELAPASAPSVVHPDSDSDVSVDVRSLGAHRATITLQATPAVNI